MRSFVPVIKSSREDKTLAYQLITYVFVLTLVAFIVVTTLTQILFSGRISKSQLENMKHLAHERIYLIDGILSHVENSLEMMCFSLSALDLDNEELEGLISVAIKKDKHIHSIALAESHADHLSARVFFKEEDGLRVNVIRDANYFYEDWFQIPLMLNKPYWTEPWVDSSGSGELIISYSAPYQTEGVRGIVSIDVNLKELQRLIIDSECLQGGNSFLVSANGTIVAHNDMSLIMNQSLFSLADEYNEPKLRELGHKMISGETGFFRIRGSNIVNSRHIYYQALETNGWSVGISMKNDVLYKDMRIVLLTNTFSAILLFLIVALIIYSRAHALTKPLRELSEAALRIGGGEFDTRIPDSVAGLEVATLSQSFRFMQESLLDYIQSLDITTYEKEKMRGDVIYAGEIQSKLIPDNTDHPIGIKELRAYGIFEPAGDVGGDLYDYFMIDEDRFCFVIADVVGTGIGAAMTMTMASTLLPSLAPFYTKSNELLRELNSFLCKTDIEANFITALLGIIDLKTGILQYTNAGHMPLYIRKLDGVLEKYSETHSTALGIFEDLNIGSEEIRLNVGDEIIIFTDGVTEAMSKEDEFFGLGGLEEVLSALLYSNPENTARAIVSRVHDFAVDSKYKDDITVLVIDYKHPRA